MYMQNKNTTKFLEIIYFLLKMIRQLFLSKDPNGFR